MRLQKTGDWIKYRTEMHNIFYYNEENGNFQWIPPEENTDKNNQGLILNDPNTMIPNDQSTISLTEDDWTEYKDSETGAVYWFNHKTNISQWDSPFMGSIPSTIQE